MCWYLFIIFNFWYFETINLDKSWLALLKLFIYDWNTKVDVPMKKKNQNLKSSEYDSSVILHFVEADITSKWP